MKIGKALSKLLRTMIEINLGIKHLPGRKTKVNI